MNEDHKTIQKLRSKIHRARAAYAEPGSNWLAAKRMHEILDSEYDSHRIEIEYQLRYLSDSGKWKTGSCYLDPDEAFGTLNSITQRYPKNKYRLILRTVTEEVISSETEAPTKD